MYEIIRITQLILIFRNYNQQMKWMLITLTKHIDRHKLIDFFITNMVQNIKVNNSFHEQKINEHHYGLNTSRSIYKIPAWEKNRKRQSTKKYLSPFTEMNFSFIALIILYNFFSSLPLILSESSSRYEGNLIQHQNFAIGKSIPRKP